MKKSINEELDSIKFLFKYRAGKVISEQEQFESKDVDFDEGMMSDEYWEYLKNHTNKGDEGMMSDQDLEYWKNQGDEGMMSDQDLEYWKNQGDEGMMSDQDLEYWKNQGDKGMEFDEDLIENRELEVPVKPGTKTPTKPKKPGTPYSPKPGPKKAPKAKMPEWLSFDAIGVNIN